MITDAELDILDEIGGQVSCKQCSKYGTALCPNFHKELEAVRSVFNQDIRFTKVLCKAFDFKREHYRLGCDLWLGVDKYIEYLKQHWWNQGKDNKWQYVGFFVNHKKFDGIPTKAKIWEIKTTKRDLREKRLISNLYAVFEQLLYFKCYN